MYVLASGSVKLTKAVHGEERIAGFVKPGEWFGFDCLLVEPYRCFNAIARENSVVCYLEEQGLSHIVRLRGGLAWSLIHVLSTELHQAQESVVNFCGGRVRHRLLNALSQCDAQFIAPKRVELAALLGVPPETVSRQMRRLKEARAH